MKKILILLFNQKKKEKEKQKIKIKKIKHSHCVWGVPQGREKESYSMFQHSVSNTQVYILSNSTTYIRKQFCSPLSNPVFMCFLETWSPKMNPNWRDCIYSCKSASLMLGLQACVFMSSSQITSFFRVLYSKTETPSSCVFCFN